MRYNTYSEYCDAMYDKGLTPLSLRALTSMEDDGYKHHDLRVFYWPPFLVPAILAVVVAVVLVVML